MTEFEVRSVDENSAAATFKFNWSGVEDQKPFKIVGRGTWVLVRHEGRLKILVEHLSR